MTIRVVARDKFLPGKKEEALALFQELIEATRKEDGNISYILHEDLADPDSTAMIEAWETKEALDAHLQSAHFQRIIPQIGPLTAGPSRLEIYSEIL
jgi:quinol monooxygenase YgiN